MSLDPQLIPASPAENEPAIPAARSPETLALLARRRSVKAHELREPGPSADQLDALVHLAARAPDHGKIGPWRFVIIEGEARARISAQLGEIAAGLPQMTPERLAFEQNKFTRAPACVMVVSSPAAGARIPEWEQQLSAAAVCYGLLLAAHAMGFAGCWLTEWPAYNAEARATLGLDEAERVAGFVYLGSPPAQPTLERARAPVRVTRL